MLLNNKINNNSLKVNKELKTYKVKLMTSKIKEKTWKNN